MDREEALAYVRRWEMAAERELEELRNSSCEERFRKADAARRLGIALGLPRRRPRGPEDEEVAERWRRLKEKLG